MTALPVDPEDQEEREWIYDIDENFFKLQAAGKCGEIQESGKRCQSPVLEWLPLDPDKPATEANRIGACGTHIRMVGPKVKRLQQNVWDRRIRDYTIAEGRHVIRTLKLAGFKLECRERHSDLTTTFTNPAEFLYTLGELGILEKIGINVEEVERCESLGERYGRKTQCMEAVGHLERGIRHNDWGDFYWDDPIPEPEPEEPLPVEVQEGEGGQFS